MVAAIGTGGIPHPNRRLLSHALRLPVKSLPPFGKSVDLGWQNPAGAPLTRVSMTGEGVLIETAGSPSVRVGLREWPMPLGRGMRERFMCPRCDASRDVLYWVDGEWGCRGCFDLGYACRHEQRWCPAIRRRAKLLRKLARCSPRGLKARLLRAQIVEQERAMLANLRRANRDLTKRMKRYGGRRANPG